MDTAFTALPAYAELFCFSNFTFLHGASHAEGPSVPHNSPATTASHSARAVAGKRRVGIHWPTLLRVPGEAVLDRLKVLEALYSAPRIGTVKPAWFFNR
jgi:hypothetical protein